jgi:nitrogen fixation NifU-like protein
MKWVYSEKVREHFQNPKNILKDPESYQADGRGEIGNAVCGDMMLMMIRVDADAQTITECKWLTYGCASAIASTSMLSEMVKGMKLKDAYEIKPQDIMKELDGLPNNKIHCSVLGDKALRYAIDDYYEKHGIQAKDEDEEKVVCHCLNITEKDIKETVFNKNIHTFEDLQAHTKVSTSCGGCEHNARTLLEEFLLLKEEQEHAGK